MKDFTIPEINEKILRGEELTSEEVQLIFWNYDSVAEENGEHHRWWYPVYSSPFFCDIFLAVAITIALIGFMTGIFIAAEERSVTVCIVGLLILAIGAVGIKHSSELTNELETFKYNKYKVTLDETISTREFLDKYEVLSREGEIFTIKEIEVDE